MPVRTVKLLSGETIPALGQGTWGLAEDARRRADEVAALRLGLDLGLTLIDTAEMYANGDAEKLVGEAIEGRREGVFLVSKVLPVNASLRGVVKACERSLRRLGTDQLDMYLLHWRGRVPLEDTVAGFASLMEEGKIRYWGVSNFDLADMAELFLVSGGTEVSTDQVLYNLTRRGIEWDLMPWCLEHNLPIMAYSPIEQGRMLSHPGLRAVAQRVGATPAQVALAWVLSHEGVTALPRSGDPEHTRQNSSALDVSLAGEDLAALDLAFPPPSGPRPLEML